MRIVSVFLKSMATVLLLSFAVSAFWTLYNVVWVGAYWSTAPIFLTVLVGFAVPVAVLSGLVALIIQVWKIK